MPRSTLPPYAPRPPQHQARLRPLLALLALLLASSAFAFDGLTLGLSASPPINQALVFDARVTYPLTVLPVDPQPLQLSLRGDVLSDFSTVPSLLIGGVLSDGGTPELAGLERYLALGGGLGFAPAPLQSPYLLLYGAAGFRLPLTSGLVTTLELGVGSAAGVVRPSFGLGLSYSFGGAR